MPRRRVWLSFLKIFGEKLMTKPFTLGDEFENEDSSHLKKNKIVALLKEKMLWLFCSGAGQGTGDLSVFQGSPGD